MALEEQMHNTLIFQNLELRKKSFKKEIQWQEKLYPILKEEQVIQYSWMMENTNERIENKSTEVMQDQIAQGFKNQVLEQSFEKSNIEVLSRVVTLGGELQND